MYRYVLCILGLALLLPVMLLTTLAITLPITSSGIGYLLGGALIGAGLVSAPRLNKYYVLTLIGVPVIILVAGMRLVLAKIDSTPAIKMVALPQGKETRWINYLIDEQDSVIFGEAIFQRVGGVSLTEHDQITSALYADYSEIRNAQKVFPSPFLSTYLNLQQPNHFDAIVIASDINAPPKFGIIFLHGFMGNVTAQCWEIAQAVKNFGAATVCPSANWIGEWWESDGQAILKASFDYLRNQGIQKIYLGGFSNGGFGISRLTAQIKNEPGLAGLIFIDGMANGADMRDVGLPILIIQGTQDERLPAAAARQIANEVGESATYVEINSDHFVIMKQPAQVQNAIAQWLEKLK